MEEIIRIKYSPEELEIIKEKAKLYGKNIKDYQVEISRKAQVKIELNDWF